LKRIGPWLLLLFLIRKPKKALRFLLDRFSGKVLKSDEHIVPEAALAALAERNIVFTVQGKASYEQQIAALRSAASGAIQ